MKVYIETYGCAANHAQSEGMAGLLLREGFELCGSADESDAVVINTCVVKEPTEHKIIDRMKRLRKQFPKKALVIAGCMPEIMEERLAEAFPGASIVGTHSSGRIAEALRSATMGRKVSMTGGRGGTPLSAPRVRKNPLVGITEISTGCDGACSYCAVRLAKGRLSCHPPEEIAASVREAVSGGCREICLTSQDNASYSHGGTDLPSLMRSVCSIEGGFMVRVGMMNPDNVMRIKERLIGAYSHPKVYRFLHLPLQSGSDSVLSRMRRRYTASGFTGLVADFRRAFPDLMLSTDVIVGFPGETDADFCMTVDVIRQVKPDIVNISKFGARPGTEASGMEPVPDGTVKARAASLHGTARGIYAEKNAGWVGWRGDVLVTEKAKGAGEFMGRTPTYKPVILKGDGILGRRVRVEVTEAHTAHLKGRMLASDGNDS